MYSLDHIFTKIAPICFCNSKITNANVHQSELIKEKIQYLANWSLHREVFVQLMEKNIYKWANIYYLYRQEEDRESIF